MLKYRSEEEEIMDDLDVSGEVVHQTLRELNTINKTLGGNAISLRALKRLCGNTKDLTIADLGCGGGDIMVEMAKWSRKNNTSFSFIGIDANPHIIKYAEQNTQAYAEISYMNRNIFDADFKDQVFDVIHCCLFVHHFSSEQLILLFRQLKRQARVGVIINDLHRHWLAYRSIQLLTHLFSRSAMVRNDASLSVARGFTRSELTNVLKAAGITSYRLTWKWAFRWQLTF